MLKVYPQIWKRDRNLLNIKFDSEPVYGNNDKYIKTKIKIYEDKVNTNKVTKYQKKMHHTNAYH